MRKFLAKCKSDGRPSVKIPDVVLKNIRNYMGLQR